MSRGSKNRNSNNDEDQYYQKLQEHKETVMGDMIDRTGEMKNDVRNIGDMIDRDN